MRKSASTVRRRLPRFDTASILVAPLGIGIILLAHWIDGSALGALMQASSALIVIGGTVAAVLISYTPTELWRAIRAAGRSFLRPDDDLDVLAATMVTLAIRGHRRGLPALEQELDDIADPYLREGLSLVVDGAEPAMIDDVLSVERHAREEEDEAPARIFEAAAGYAPTMGIMGAVLGLMRVMEHLGTPGVLGGGIALAFVATVYGVGIANLVLLPLAGRLRERAAYQARRRDLMTHGLHGLQQRLNPRMVAYKLRSFSSRVPRIDELAATNAPSRQVGSPRMSA